MRAASTAMYFDAMSSSADGALRPRNSFDPRNVRYGFISAAEMVFAPFDWADTEAERPPTRTHVINHEARR
jgi:hypothetical protein